MRLILFILAMNIGEGLYTIAGKEINLEPIGIWIFLFLYAIFFDCIYLIKNVRRK